MSDPIWPVRYRWDVYAKRKTPTGWHRATPGKLTRAMRALTMPQERLRVEFSNRQMVVLRPKGTPR